MHRDSRSRAQRFPRIPERDALSLKKFLDKYRYAVLLALTVFYTARRGVAGPGEGRSGTTRSSPSSWRGRTIGAGTWKAALACDAKSAAAATCSRTGRLVVWRERSGRPRLPGDGGVLDLLPLPLSSGSQSAPTWYYGDRRAAASHSHRGLPLFRGGLAPTGPELAFCGLALVAWQASAGTAAGGAFLTLPMLAVSLTGAIFCHYYAILMYIPLAGGGVDADHARAPDRLRASGRRWRRAACRCCCGSRRSGR